MEPVCFSRLTLYNESEILLFVDSGGPDAICEDGDILAFGVFVPFLWAVGRLS